MATLIMLEEIKMKKIILLLKKTKLLNQTSPTTKSSFVIKPKKLLMKNIKGFSLHIKLQIRQNQFYFPISY